MFQQSTAICIVIAQNSKVHNHNQYISTLTALPSLNYPLGHFKHFNEIIKLFNICFGNLNKYFF